MVSGTPTTNSPMYREFTSPRAAPATLCFLVMASVTLIREPSEPTASAADLGTGREQSIRVALRGGHSDEELERMAERQAAYG